MQRHLVFIAILLLKQVFSTAQVSFQCNEISVYVHDAERVYVDSESTVYVEGGIAFGESSALDSIKSDLSTDDVQITSQHNHLVRINNVSKERKSTDSKIQILGHTKTNPRKEESDTAVIVPPATENSYVVSKSNTPAPLPNNDPSSKNRNYFIQIQIGSTTIDDGNTNKRKLACALNLYELDRLESMFFSVGMNQSIQYLKKISLKYCEYFNDYLSRPPPFEMLPIS